MYYKNSHTAESLKGDSAGKESGVSREMIGKYERGEAVPSIEAAKKMPIL